MEKDSFNAEMLRSLRNEINIRIALHFALLLIKYTLGTTVILTVVATNFPNRFAALGLLIAATLAFLLDVVILENLGWIRTVGAFQKNYIENTSQPIVRWESKGAQTGGAWNCFTVQGYILGTWIIGPLLFVAAFFLELDAGSPLSVFGIIVTTYFLTYSLYLTFRHLGRRYEDAASSTHSPIVG